MILTVTPNPSIDETLFVNELILNDRNVITKIEVDAGGKGANLSRVAVELGGESTATGFIAGEAGEMVLRVLRKQGVIDRFVVVPGETRTNFQIETANDEPPTALSGPSPITDESHWLKLVETVSELAPSSKWVALGGSIPTGGSDTVYRTLTDLAHVKGARSLVDADGRLMEIAMESCPDLIKPNEAEAERLLGWKVETPADGIRASKELRDRLSQKNPDAMVIVSLGSQGAALCTEEGVFFGDAVRVEVKSTIGSGDSMLAAFLVAHEEGNNPSECLAWGIAAGAATATTGGSEIGRRDVFESLLPRAVVEQVS